MLENVYNTVNSWLEPVKEWLFENHNNPLLWLGFFLIGVAIFSAGYAALHKD